jgi:CPA1 family monovalent cation:H+ antiporter
MSLNILDATALLVCAAAGFGWLNARTLRLPMTISLVISAMLSSLLVLAIDALIPSSSLGAHVRETVLELDFADALLKGMLSVLLFAGALHTDIRDLKANIKPIILLACVGTLISTALVTGASYGVLMALGIPLSFWVCAVFGVLISPTDPIAVLGIMKEAKAPRALQTKVIGESLINDGIAVVLFIVLLKLARIDAGLLSEDVTAGYVVGLLAQEVVGGIAFGLAVGYVTYRALRPIDEPNLEILISLAAVLGLNMVALKLHLSAPLAAVVAGLFIGNHGRVRAMSERTSETLDTVWSFVDELLNAVLFLFVGLEVLAITFNTSYMVGALVMIPLTLAARYVAVWTPIKTLGAVAKDFAPGTVTILTWGGLKGGISVALAMSLPNDLPGRDEVLTITYGVVIFSIVAQGLTVGPLVRRFQKAEADAEAQATPAPK